MQKDKALKIIAVISAVLSGISVLLGCMVVIFPQSCGGLFYGGVSFANWSIGSAMPFMMIEALFPLLLMALAVFNAVSGTMTCTKGIVSAVLTVLYSIVKTLAGFWIWKRSLNVCVYEGQEIVSLLNVVNSALSMINYLNFFALLLLISVASIEIYASVKADKI
ncbi:MAG: hypothetical protein K2N27_09320 [Ruminococcus sp.]|nr:hypothetical protein [Ruminococcus sp.]